MKCSSMLNGNIPGTQDPMNPISLCSEPPNVPNEPATDGAPAKNSKQRHPRLMADQLHLSHQTPGLFKSMWCKLAVARWSESTCCWYYRLFNLWMWPQKILATFKGVATLLVVLGPRQTLGRKSTASTDLCSSTWTQTVSYNASILQTHWGNR